MKDDDRMQPGQDAVTASKPETNPGPADRAPGPARAGAPIEIAVVGHTNVGKTSLLRTLLRDADFGEVSHRPSTTRHVEGAALRIEGRTLLVLHDTPGLEDGIGLRDYLAQLAHASSPFQDPGPGAPASGPDRLDGPDCIAAFLRTAEARGRYEQEAKVLRQLQSMHAGLYVVDVREPVLPKYRDELAVLSMAGKPLLPVFNFVRAADSQEPAWRGVLARLGLHAAVRFDTVAPPVDGERRLYDSLALLLEPARPVLEQLQADLAAQALERRRTAARLMAELLVDVAAARLEAGGGEAAAQSAGLALHEAVRQREQRCTQALLALYAFRRGDAATQGFPGFDGVWGEDLFSAETLKRFGVRLGGGVAAGAAIGAGLDVMLAGLSLGTGTLVGALAGGTLQTLRDHGLRAWGRLQGQRVLRVDDAVLRLLAMRQALLVQALEARGHAAQSVIAIDELAREAAAGASGLAHDWRRGPLPAPIEKARAHPEWSGLAGSARALRHPARQAQVDGLAPALMPAAT